MTVPGTPVVTLGAIILRTSVNVWSTTLGFPKLPTTGGLDTDLATRAQQLLNLVQSAHRDWAAPSPADVYQRPEVVAQFIDKARLYPNTLLPAPPTDPVKKSSSMAWIVALGTLGYFFFMTKTKNTSRKGRGR